MEIEIRPPLPEELRAFIETVETAFYEGVTDDAFEKIERYVDPDRMLIAVDGDEMVAGSGAFETSMSIPGGEIPVAAITMIGVVPSHRRRGILRRMMERLFEDAIKRGEPVGVLWASEDVIYQRYGFGLASLQGQIEIDRHRAAFLRDEPPSGRLRIIELDEAAKVLPGVYERVRAEIPGMLSRDREWWEAHRLSDLEEDRHGGGPLQCAILEIEGRAEAYALYRGHEEWTHGMPRGWIRVWEAMGTTPAATKEIWRFLLSLDLADYIRALLLPADHPLPLLLAEPRWLRFQLVDTYWLRTIDVPASLAARSYAGDGSLVIDVKDSFRPANRGRWRLEATGGEGNVTKTRAAPDLRMDVSDLAAVYLGGFSFADLVRAARVEQLRAGAVGIADELFRTARKPWCPEIF